MAKGKKTNGQCVYCWQEGPVTDDHIPPKNLFAKPRPDDLIKVPACQKCNGQASLDDEYFRLMLCARQDVASHPEAKKIQPTIMRSLERPDKVRFAEKFFSTMRATEVISQAGLCLGPAQTYRANLKRVSKVPARIVRGLFSKEFKRLLPLNYVCAAYQEAGLAAIDQPTYDKIWGVAAELQKEPPKGSKGQGVFSYWYLAASDDPNVTFWLFIFFETVGFIGMTAPLEKIRGDAIPLSQ